MLTELTPFIQLGFAGLFAIALLALVRAYMVGLIKQNGEMVVRVTAGTDKLGVVLENHLSSIARSLTLVEERLSVADRRAERLIPAFDDMQSSIRFMMTALVQATIVSPGTKATIEPATTPDTRAALDEMKAQQVERARVQARDAAHDAREATSVKIVDQPVTVRVDEEKS